MQLSNDSLESPSSTRPALINSWFPDESHPCCRFERSISDMARSDDAVLEISSGSSSASFCKLPSFVGAVRGVDMTNMASLANASIDIAFCRYMVQPAGAMNRYYSEVFRTLRPGGIYVFLAPHYWGYKQMISRFITHRTDRSAMVNARTGSQKHAEPECLESNTGRSIKRLADHHGFVVEQLDYLDQGRPNLGTDHPPGSRYATFLARHPAFRCLRGLIMCRLKKKFMRDLF